MVTLRLRDIKVHRKKSAKNYPKQDSRLYFISVKRNALGVHGLYPPYGTSPNL
jgi:hypothetical protein